MKTDKEQLAFSAMKIELAKNEFYEKQIIELQIALNLISE